MDPGARGLQGFVCCAFLFTTASICLYVSGMSLNSWSVATSPENANGELGLYSICPNTQIFAKNDVLQFLNVTELNTACLYVDYNCNIKIGLVVNTPTGNYYTYYWYNIFKPRPQKPNPEEDLIYQLLLDFPGRGDCSAYINARIFGIFAGITAMFGWCAGPFGLCAPHRRKSTGSSGSGCICCAFICAIVSISVWAGAVINWQTSEYGAAFWCMMSAAIIGFLSMPCLSAFALVHTEDPEYAQPPTAQGQYQEYGTEMPQYNNQYGYPPPAGYPGQYPPPPQGYYPQAPPVGQQPPPPPAAQYQGTPPPPA